MIKKLHHAAYRCKNSEDTRRFYEDFLGLPLVHAFEINETKTGRNTSALHTFYRMDDGSHIAFFEVPSQPFNFINQHDFDLHIALEVTESNLINMFEKGNSNNIETRGISDHGFISSIYLRDPNGYVVELTTKTKSATQDKDNSTQDPHKILEEWIRKN